MKVLFKKGLCLLFVVCLMASGTGVFAATGNTDNPKVFIMGDSTAAGYSESLAPRTGWGQVLHNFFTDGYMVKNYAVSGESAHRCYDTWWNSMKTQVSEGDYVLIQFGHNDSAQGTGTDDEGNEVTDYSRWGDPELGSDVGPNAETNEYSYKWYLRQFIEYIDCVGAYPILVTSVERRNHACYMTDGAYDETKSGLYKWQKAMKELADELGALDEPIQVPVIDLWSASRSLIQTMEETEANSSKSLYLILGAGESDNYPNGVEDNTHLSMTGAMEMARTFANLLSRTELSLKKYLVNDIAGVTTNTVLPENIDENFQAGALGKMTKYNGWVVGGANNDETTTPVVQIAKESENSTNKTLNFKRDGALNTETDTGITYARYDLTNTLGAVDANAVEDAERYVKFKFKFRSDANGTEFSILTGSLYVLIQPATSTLRLKGTTDSSYNSAAYMFGASQALPIGTWYDITIYYDLKEKKTSVFVGTTQLFTEWASPVSEISRIQFNSARCSKAGTNATWDYKIDNISLSAIREEAYCDAVGKLPTNVIFREKFDNETAGSVIKTTSNAFTNNYTYNKNGSTITCVTDPKDSANKVAEFKKTQYNTRAIHTLSKTFDTALTDGFYSFTFRMYSADADSGSFWINLKGENNTDNYIELNFGAKTVKMPSWTIEEGYVVKSDISLAYEFAQNTWHDVEIDLDLTEAEETKASLYIDQQAVFTNQYMGYNGKGKAAESDGTLKTIALMGHANAASYASEASVTDGVYACYLLDDLELKSLTTQTTGITVVNGKLTQIAVRTDRLPSDRQKMIAVVYQTDAGGAISGIRGAEPVNVTVRGTSNIALSAPIQAAAGDIVKVYFWDTDTLRPIGSVFSQTLQ